MSYNMKNAAIGFGTGADHFSVRQDGFSDEHRNNIRKSRLGKSLSNETKQKLSKALKNRKRGPMPNERKDKISETLKQTSYFNDMYDNTYECVSPTGEVYVIKTNGGWTKWCKDNKLDPVCMRAVAQGKTKKGKHKGWTCKLL